MAKNNNKGYSLIEIIVAVAVFAILIIPLTTQLISSVNTNNQSKKKQYAVEVAEEVMETVKTADLDDVINITDGNDSGNYDLTLDTAQSSTKTVSISGLSDVVTYNENVYTCDTISLGQTYENYSCTVTVSDLPYKVSALGYVWDSDSNELKTNADGSYVTVSSAVGTVRNLDNTQSAIITGATYMGASSGVSGNNLDTQAYDYFLKEKIALLKSEAPVYYSQYMSGNGDSYFDSDYFEKVTTITVSKTALGKYSIKCEVKYTDHTALGVIKSKYENATNALNVYVPANGTGVVYEQEYDELPPIYLLYVPAIYGSKYNDYDYINIDTSSLDEDVDIYLIETAADVSSTYEELICNYFKVSSLDELVFSNTESNKGASDVIVSVESTGTGSGSGTTSVYTNFAATSTTLSLNGLADDTSDDTYLYDITVEITDSEGNTTKLTGTRGN